ncbi:Vacuolar ATPase assembly integral membrane protein VMA21 [Taphrina deformans PYCC 5710]|uniref:Vacuolar ATPase assembly integral membrane protein VMA21 n=1 Tax=Taphrina deformans (strain PYCC 5710 / ATCC 11124 / CBS 356.35 / IMI 108563 / JCM 9778 / NBRC 8474) TaxID=1097556 RepID=R4X6J6_TAPDE|nr:Vacuolar ATPase assembly integral membrane protein VMA21 [Taphrina deformans PYCC 5710]|eukprot:CCG80745.1 Vacuolar ATPase assembly integral membrane protein VMA21 [Taphrina deformans PYCC 5710]
MSQSPSISSTVIAKLLFFSAAMVVLPLSAYYLSLEYLFSGYKTTYAAITAAVTANLVVAGYVVVAFLEDDSEPVKQEKAVKKQQ